jgi:2-succinyl-6-hydroxy-2,4-cyclohexadiene-1-carboxylate synthase
VIDGLGERYRALAPDLRGHGSASSLRPVGFAECLADIAGLEPARFTLTGYSMGARLALLFALAHPERVERLVLVSGTAGIADDVERAERRRGDEALAAELEGTTIERFAERWARDPLFKGQPRAVAETAHEDRLRNDPAGLAAALRGLGTGAMEPAWAHLAELRAPVTLVAGERDSKFRTLAERMGAAIPAARVVIVPGAGHAVHLEAPGIVAALISEG